jgi:S-formylglutathione hydrolase FrmB
LNIDANNCIKNRLLKLLIYLNAQYPSQNWAQFFNGSTDVNWSKVVIAGHSQGGGHAFYIAKKVAVDRTIAFASIDWNNSLNQNASWVTQPGATDISKYYSFNHTGDEVFGYANVQTQLAAMGVTGPAVNTETATSPYSNSHTLTTTATPAIATFGNHSVICLDQYITKDAGGNVKPTIIKAWEYLLGK